MTTSISNSSAPPIPAHVVSSAARPATRDEATSVGTGQTWASRVIVFMLCATIIWSALAYGTVHNWSLALFYMGAVFCVLCWVVDALQSGRLRVSRSLLPLPLIGLIIVGLVQLLPLRRLNPSLFSVAPVESLSLHPYATRIVILQLLALVLYFATALAFIDNPKRLRLVVRTIIIFGFVLAFYSLIQFFGSPDAIYFGLRKPPASIPFGPYVNRHNFATYMEMTLALPLGLLFAGAVATDRRLLYAFAVVFMGIALLMTSSRGGMISLVVEIGMIVTLSLKGQQAEAELEGRYGKRRRVGVILRRAMLGAGLILVLLVGLLSLGGGGSIDRVIDLAESGDFSTGRTHFWRITLDVIRNYPLLGAGLGALGVAYTRYDTVNPLLRLEQAHNDYLQILADAGIVGGLLGLAFVVILFRDGLKRIQSRDKFRRGVAIGALSGCGAVLVHSLFDFPLHGMSISLLFLVLAALATINGQVEEASANRHRRRRSQPGHVIDANITHLPHGQAEAPRTLERV